MKLIFKYRTIVIMFLFFINSINSYSVVYNGDQSLSPILRFLKSLFMGESSAPTPITIQGGESGQLYNYNDFNQGSGIVTTPHPAVNNSGGGGASSMWNFTPSTTSSMSGGGGTSTPSPKASSGLSFQLVTDATVSSGGSSSGGGGSGGGGSSSGGGGSSSSGFALLAVGFPQSNLVTAVNGQENSNTSPTNNGGTQGQFGGDGWLPDPGEPMPIGDGTLPMLLFALGYAAWQYRKTKKEKLSKIE